jgi:hypothetical protein
MDFFRKLFRRTSEAKWLGAIFWFDWRDISKMEYSNYGNHAYMHLLPLFAPNKSSHPYGYYVFFDGDCLPLGKLDIPTSGSEDALCLDRVARYGFQNCYVVAQYGTAGIDFSDFHYQLTNPGISGYLGKIAFPLQRVETFEHLMMQMSLPFSFTIECSRFKKSSFTFVSDDKLRAWGFEPSFSGD